MQIPTAGNNWCGSSIATVFPIRRRKKLERRSSGMRRADRRTQERELPLAESPAVGVGPTETYHHDKEHWRRQIAADGDLSPLARQIANLIEAKYISNKMGTQLCAWCSITTLRSAVGRRRALVNKALHELEARGHCKLQSQGQQKPRLIALVLRRSETVPILTPPAPTLAQPDIEGGPSDQEVAAIETASIEAVAEVQSTATDAFHTAALAAGAAIPLRRAPLSPVPPAPFVPTWSGPTPPRSGVAVSLSRRAYVEPTSRKVTPESEAKRIKEAEQREADATARERYDAFIKSWYANQARSEPLFELDYDPYPYNYNSSTC